MADYQLSATLRARDAGFSSTISHAQKATEKLQSTVGKIKAEQDLKMKVGVDGLARIERLRGAIEAARNNANKPLSVRLKDAATQQLNKIKSQINSLTSKAHQVIVNVKTNGAEKLSGIKNSISEGVGGAAMAAGATMLGTAGIGYGVVNAVQSQMEFEKNLSKIKALMVSGRTEEETNQVMTMLTAKAEELGAQTKFTAAEVAEGMRYQAIAGWTPKQIEAGIKPLTSLAAAGDLNLQQTSDILTDSLTAFGLKAGEFVNVNGKMVEASKHFADLMTATFTKSNTDIQMLGEASKYAAPVVNALYSNASASEKMMAAQDTFLLMGLQANAGIKSSQAGTSSRAILTRLASSQRNANFASRGLGVSLKDEVTGEARPLIDFFSDLRKVFSKGVDLDKVADVFEEMSGEKIHADTRRKLDEYYANVQKNGGKLTGMDKTKMGAMLAGQEAMSGLLAILTASDDDFNKIKEALDNADGLTDKIAEIQMDNLAGSITKMGSAWDAFQRSFVKGDAGAGLRSFVDSVTDSLSKANELFKDGIDFSDLVSLGADAVNKLKNKFLELDGIGSILAGGALFWGLKKIMSLALSVKDTIGGLMKIRSAADLGNTIRGNKAAGGLPSTTTGVMNVTASTMNVKAGVVNVSGAVKGGGVPTAGGQAGGKGATVLTNQQRVNDYYARKQQILTSGTTVAGGVGTATAAGTAATGGRLAMLRGAGGAIGGAGAFAALFGVMDVIAARSNSEYTNNQAVEQLRAAQTELKTLQAQGADINQINSQLAAIRTAEENVRNVAEMNRVNERRTNAGVAGMMAGTLTGAAIGSMVPIVGTAIGALIGGFLGQMGGTTLADYIDEINPFKKKKTYGQSSASALDEEAPDIMVSKMSEALSRRREADKIERERAEKEKATSEYALSDKEYSSATARRREADEKERINRQQEMRQHQFTTTEEIVAGSSAAINRRRQADIVETERNRKAVSKAEFDANTKTRQFKENRERFGNTTLGDNYLAQTSNEMRAVDYTKKYAMTAEESARQRTAMNFQTTGQEYINLGKDLPKLSDLPAWWDSVKTKFTSTETPQAKNFTPATADFSKFTTTQITPQNTFAEDFKNRFVGAGTATLAANTVQTATTAQNFTATQSQYQNLNQSAFNLSETFDSLKTKFGGTETTNFTPATPTFQPQPLQPPAINLNKDAFNIQALKERFTTPEIAPQERQFNFNQPMANLPNYSANIPPMATPQFDLPDFDIKGKISTEVESISTSVSSVFENFKTSASSTFSEVSTSISTGLESAKTSLSTFSEEISTSFSTGFETLKNSASTSFEEIATSMSTGLETIRTSLSTIGEEISTSFVTSFETLRTSASTIFEEISMSMTTGLETVTTSLSTFGESISTSFSASFETISTMAATTFSSLSATISGGVEAARATITTAFSSAAAEVQGIWGAIPGFFSGIFGSLGGIAAGAGAAIAAGINSGIGMIMSAWDALSGWLSAKISSLASMASSAAASIGIGSNYKGTSYWRGGFTEVNEHGGELIILPSGQEIYPYDTTKNIVQETKIAHNAKGTSFFSGGWSEVNEHGGELMYLPTGTKIIPHATTVRILREQIKEKLNDSKSSTSSEIFSKGFGTSTYNFGTSAQNFATVSEFTNNTASSTRNAGNSRAFDNRSAGTYQTFQRYKNLSEVNNKYDELGNLQGVNIPDYNRITADDSIAVKRAKQAAQRNQLSQNIFDTNNRTAYRQNSSALNGTATNTDGRRYSNINAPFTTDTFDARRLTTEQGATANALENYSNVFSKNNRISAANTTSAALRGVTNNASAIFKQQQRQNSALPALEVNAESNNLRRYENRQSITTNRRFENATAFNDIQSGLPIAHNYTGTSYFKGGLTTVNEHGGEIIALPDGRNILPQYTFQNIFKDSLGNIQGLQIPEYNRITAEDSTAVRRAKQDAQYKQLLNQSAQAISSTKSTHFQKASAVSESAGTVSNVFNNSQNQNLVKNVNKAAQVDKNIFDNSQTLRAATAKIQYPTAQTAEPNYRAVNRPRSLNPLDILVNVFKRSSTNNRHIVRAGNILSTIQNVTRRGNNYPVSVSTPPFNPNTNTPTANMPFPVSTPPFNPNISSGGDFRFSNAKNIVSTQKHSSNIFDGLINFFKQSQQIFNPASWGGIFDYKKNFSTFGTLDSITDFGGDTLNNPVEELSTFNQFDNLPTPELSMPKTAGNSSTNNTSNTTNNSNSSKVNFNFGDVNINNGMDLDNILHQFSTLFNQGAANSVQI